MTSATPGRGDHPPRRAVRTGSDITASAGSAQRPHRSQRADRQNVPPVFRVYRGGRPLVVIRRVRRAGYAAPMTDDSAAPLPVRAAGLLVGLQGVAGVVVAVVLLLRGSTGPVPTLATAVWFAGFGAILIAVGVNLTRGRSGARTPAVVGQILLLGVAWYATGPSSRPGYGIPAAVFCILVLALLFSPPAVRWVTGEDESTE